MTQKKRIILELRGVTREFSQGKQKIVALHPTNFKVHAGEFVAIIGPSGSGKSTFLTVAGGLQNPTKGKVVVAGEDITSLSKKELSQVRLSKIGFILQASNLVPYLTTKQQLLLFDKVARRTTQHEAINELFDTLGIKALQDKYPSDLSGGERQRVAIAKTLYGTSELILADEPTASLDTKRAYEVAELLVKETHERKKATIMVTHDERLISYCDTVYEMHDGVLKQRPQAARKKRS